MESMNRATRDFERSLERKSALNLKRALALTTAIAAMAATAGTAHAVPTAADARAAVKDADFSLSFSIASAGASRGLDEAEVQIARTRTLEARAVRIARRAASRSSDAGAARLLSRAAGAVDRGFNAYAALLPTAPAQLQAPLLDALKQFNAVRVELVGELSALVDVLPPEIRGQVIEAITAYQATGDLDALIAALRDPATLALLRAHLGDLIDQAVATMQAQIDDPDYVATLPEGDLERIQDVIVLIKENRGTIITVLTQILDEGGTNLPQLSAGMCDQLVLVFGQLGIPLPSGLCAASAA